MRVTAPRETLGTCIHRVAEQVNGKAHGCVAKPSPCMAVLIMIRRPRRSRFRSIRRSPMSSTAPIMPPRCSISKSKAIATAASAIRPPRCWRSGSPQLEGGVGGAQRRLGPGGALLRHRQCRRNRRQYRLGAAALRHDLYAVRHVLPSQGVARRVSRESTAPQRHREADRRQHPRASSARASAIPAGNICDIEALAAVAHRTACR